MGLLPERIELPAFQLVFMVDNRGDYEQSLNEAVLAERRVTAIDGPTRICLLQVGSELRIFGPKRGCALHLLALQGFMQLLARSQLSRMMLEMGMELGFCEFDVRIGDQRRRWGSCSKRVKGRPRICLNWRAILLPPLLLRQLCLHELCHLVEMNHSKAFHNLLAKYNPESRLHERELGRAWQFLPPWAAHKSHFANNPREHN